MKKEKMSIMDAFLALKDLDEDYVTEGKSYNLRDSNDLDDAEEFIKEDATKEVQLEVIDPDADAIEHIKSGEEYVGNMLLQCVVCKATKFISADDLVVSEADDDIYNIDDECPHCHKSGSGFSLIGQVGKVEDEHKDAATIVNDETNNEDEATVDNDLEEEPEEESEEDVEETTEESEEELDDTSAWDETNAEDDTEDAGTVLGDEYDEDDVEYDDTEEKPEKSEEEPEEESEEEISFDMNAEEDSKKKKKEESLQETTKEVLTEELDVELPTIEDFIYSYFIEPGDLTVTVYSGNDKVYEGAFEDIPYSISSEEMKYFSVPSKELVLLADKDVNSDDNGITISYLLDAYKGDSDVIVEDASSFEDIYSGSIENVIDTVGDYWLSSIENKNIELYIDNGEYEPIEVLYRQSAEESLLEDIFIANNLNPYKVNNIYSNEYAINESLKYNEDLDIIYKEFILPTNNKELVEKFKNITGYKDALDEARERKDVFKDDTISFEGVQSEFTTKDATKRVVKDDHKCTCYAGADEEEQAKRSGAMLDANFEPTKEGKKIEVKESVTSFRSRKCLSEAVESLKAQGKSFKIKKSLKEGYRYDLVTEQPLKEKLSKDEIDALIADEQEAIEGYRAAELNATEKEADVLFHIEDEEYEHINELEKLANGEIPTLEEGKKVCPKCGKEICECGNVEEAFTFNTPAEVEEEPEVIDAQGELVDEPEVVIPTDETSVVPQGMNEDDIEVVQKIQRIASDIKDAISDAYGIDCDERLIVADIIRDLQLVGGNIDPNTLEDTPLNNLTKEMYNEFNGLYDLIGELFGVNFSRAQRLEAAIRSLDSPQFSTAQIQAGIQSPRFLQAAQRAQIPYIPTQQLLAHTRNNENLNEDVPFNRIENLFNFIDGEDDFKESLNESGFTCSIEDLLDVAKWFGLNTAGDLNEFAEKTHLKGNEIYDALVLCKEIGLKGMDMIDVFMNDNDPEYDCTGCNFLEKLKRYRALLPDNFSYNEAFKNNKQAYIEK